MSGLEDSSLSESSSIDPSLLMLDSIRESSSANGCKMLSGSNLIDCNAFED